MAKSKKSNNVKVEPITVNKQVEVRVVESYKAAVIVAIIAIFVVAIVASNPYCPATTNTDNTTTTDTSEISKYTTAKTMADYFTMKKENSINVFYIARPTCGYCAKFQPVLIPVISKYNLKINYVNTDNEDSTAMNKFMNSDTRLNEFGTPTLIVTKNDEIIYIHIGYMEEASLITFLKDSKLIAE